MHDAMDIAQCRHKLTGQVNDVVCTLSTADPITKITLLKTYCLSLYGSELWRRDNSANESVCISRRADLRCACTLMK